MTNRKPSVPTECEGLKICLRDDRIVIYDANWEPLTGERHDQAYARLNAYLAAEAEWRRPTTKSGG